MKLVLVFLLTLPIQAAVGAYYQSTITPYITFVGVLSILILGVFNKTNTKHLPLYLASAALAMVWQTSLLGSYIVGVDIHGEYYIVTQAIKNGWNIAWADGNNTSWVLGVLAPALSKLGFDPIWQFKVLYPLIFAMVPVILFYTYRRFFSEKTAFLACFFFLMLPMFHMETISMVKSMVALFFLALLIFFIFKPLHSKTKLFLVILCVIGAVTSHYTIGVATVMYLSGATLILAVLRKLTKLLTVAAVASIFVLIAYFSIVGSSSMLNTVTSVVTNLATVTLDTQSTELKQVYLERTQPEKSTSTYLDNQDPLIRTALGLDFFKVSTLGKVFRILQILTQLLIAAGLIVLWKRRKQVPSIYSALVIVSVCLLIMCVFVPFFSTAVSATRMYQIALLVVSPLLVIGASLFTKTRVILVILICYFMFTSGFVFEVAKSVTLNRLDTPYTFAFSNYRTNIVGIFNEDDINCALWLSTKERTQTVCVDYQSATLMLGTNQNYATTYLDNYIPIIGNYIFLNTWNTTHNELVFGRDSGQRYYKSLPTLANTVEVHRKGDAVVYEVLSQ